MRRLATSISLSLVLVVGAAAAHGQDAPPEEAPAPAEPASELATKLAGLRDAAPADRAARLDALLAEKPALDDVLRAFDAGLPAPKSRVGWTVLQATDAAGTARPYHLYVPAKVAEAGDPAPLLVDMHGGVGRPEFITDEQFARFRGQWTALADQHGFSVAMPLGRRDCMWWSDVGVGHVRATIRDAKRHAPVDDDRVFGTGFSDGGSGSYHLAFATPEPFAGLLPMNGHPAVAIRFSGRQHYLSNALLTPLFVAMTQDDGLYPGKTVLPHVQGLFDIDASVRLVSYPHGGHTPSYFEDLSPAFASFLNETERNPLPDRFRWSASHVDTGAVRWLAIEEVGASRVAHAFPEEPLVMSRPGRVVLGFQIDQAVTEGGVGVGPVNDGSLAAGMGLRTGDRIVAIDGTDTPDMRALRTVLGAKSWGTSIVVRVRREGSDEPLDLSAALPPFTPQPSYPRDLPTATVGVTRRDNTVDLTACNVRAVRLLVSPRQFDLSKPVVVRVDGKEVARKADGWSVAPLLTSYAEHADTGRLFAGSIRVELPAADAGGAPDAPAAPDETK